MGLIPNLNLNGVLTEIGKVVTDVGTVLTNIGTANTNVNTVNTTTKDVQTKVNAITTNLATANTNINAIKTKVDAQGSVIKSIQYGVVAMPATATADVTIPHSSVILNKSYFIINGCSIDIADNVSRSTVILKSRATTSAIISSSMTGTYMSGANIRVSWQLIEYL